MVEGPRCEVRHQSRDGGLYKRIGNIHAVQKWLGHMKPETTARCIVAGDDDQLLAARATHAFHVTRTEATAAAA